MSIENVLRKVRGLRALAKSSNQHEAEAAAAHADALIQKYRLEQAELGDDGPTEELKEHVVETSRHNVMWKSQLLNTLSRHYGCFAYHHSGIIVTTYVAGRQSDVEIVKYMYAWIADVILRLSLSESGVSARDSFRKGSVTGFGTALAYSKRQATESHLASHGDSAAMIVANKSTQAKAFVTTKHTIINPYRARSIADDEAFERGKAAGSAIHVGESLPSSPSNRRRVLTNGSR